MNNTILVNMEGLHEIEAALKKSKDKSKYVLRAAINDSAKEIEKRMASGASKRYARNDKGVKPYKAVTKLSKAKMANLAATITVKDKISDLYDFTLNDRTYYPGSKGAPNWIRAKQLKVSRLQSLAARKGRSDDQYKAFVVKYPKTKHKALAQRVPGSHMKGNPKKEAIRSLYATSKPRSEEFIFKKDIEKDVSETLVKSINEQIERFL